MSIVKPKAKKKATKSKAVKAALVDGLLSDSATHVHMLLQSQDQQLMSDTMQQLALNPKSIDTFLRVLADLVAKHPQSADRALQWLNRLVETHSGYIVSSPDLTSRLCQLRSQLQLRLASLQRLLMLKGRLDLLLSLHARAAAGDSGDPRQRSSAAVVHQDTDSEVTEAEDDEDEEDDEGDGDEGPDDLAGQLLGNAESGSEAEMESDIGGSDSEEGEEDDEDAAGAIDDEDDDDEVDDDDEAEDDEEEEGEGDFSSDSSEGDGGGAPVGRVR